MQPFTVLHVCMGNICRSPMAELLFAQVVGDAVYSHSVGTGGWHAGQPMDPPAAAQLRSRGVDPSAFRARKLATSHIDGSDLILTATAEQFEIVVSMRPDAHPRTFVLGELGRLLPQLNTAALPSGSLYDRGVALVAAVAQARGAASPLPTDDLADPYGQGRAQFTRIANQITQTTAPLAAAISLPG